MKDKSVALILMLLDQGRFRLWEITGLSIKDIVCAREICRLGKRRIHCSPEVSQALRMLCSNRDPKEPLFVVPKVDSQSDLSYFEPRRIGPHLITNLLVELGIPLEGLQTYHASNAYITSMQGFLDRGADVGYAHRQSLIEVASELGYNLNTSEDLDFCLSVIQEQYVDPVVIRVIEENAKMRSNVGAPLMDHRSFMSIPRVSSDLTSRTPSESVFSKWLHTTPLHNYV